MIISFFWRAEGREAAAHFDHVDPMGGALPERTANRRQQVLYSVAGIGKGDSIPWLVRAGTWEVNGRRFRARNFSGIRDRSD